MESLHREMYYCEIMMHRSACVCLYTRWPICGGFCNVFSGDPQRKLHLSHNVLLNEKITSLSVVYQSVQLLLQGKTARMRRGGYSGTVV